MDFQIHLDSTFLLFGKPEFIICRDLPLAIQKYTH